MSERWRVGDATPSRPGLLTAARILWQSMREGGRHEQPLKPAPGSRFAEAERGGGLACHESSQTLGAHAIRLDCSCPRWTVRPISSGRPDRLDRAAPTRCRGFEATQARPTREGVAMNICPYCGGRVQISCGRSAVCPSDPPCERSRWPARKRRANRKDSPGQRYIDWPTDSRDRGFQDPEKHSK